MPLVDVTPPKISCKTPQTFYADEGKTTTSVYLENTTATATDNSGIAPKIIQTPSVVNGTKMKAETAQLVHYTATDAENNKDECTILISVKGNSTWYLEYNVLIDYKLVKT